MPLYDFKCKKHGAFEDFLSSDTKFWFAPCPKCGKMSPKLPCACKVNVANEDAPHIREAANMLLDKESAHLSDDPKTRALAANPTRSNLNAYMKDKKIRYAENEGGAPPRFRKPEPVDKKALVNELYQKKRQRDRLEVRS